MDKTKIQNVALLILLVALSIVLGLILYPFLGAFALALTLAIIFSPVFKFITKYFKNRTVSATITLVLVLVIVLIPLSFIITNVIVEAKQLFESYQSGSYTDVFSSVSHSGQALVTKYLPWLQIDVAGVKNQVVSWIADNFAGLFSSAFKIGFNAFIVILTLFYLFRDGESFKKNFSYFSPLKDEDNELLIKKVKETVTSVIRGSLFVAILQGGVTGLGLYLFGVPQPILWGSIAAVTALIPTVGTALILIPSILYLLATGDTLSAVGLTIWGVAFVGMIDNLIGPYLIQRGIKIHPLLILTSVIGGISLFGLIGFILGPIILSLTVTLLNIYSVSSSAKT